MIETYSNEPDKASFIQRFSQIPRIVNQEENRPLPEDQYWTHLLSVFSDQTMELFIFREMDKDLGRILLTTSPKHQGYGLIGMVEYQKDRFDIIAALEAKALEWFDKQGVNKVIAPVDINIWFGNRFKITENTKHYAWEPSNPSEYPKHFLKLGYELEKEYISQFYTTNDVSFKRTKKAYDDSISKGYSFDKVDLNDEKSVKQFYQLNLNGFSQSFLFEKISEQVYAKTYLAALKKTDLKYSFILKDQNQVARGYIYTFLDTEDQRLIIKSILVDPALQGAHLASALLHRSLMVADEEGIKRSAGAMVRKGNVSEFFFKHLGVPEKTHTYGLYIKNI